jgi:hypothetical protein
VWVEGDLAAGAWDRGLNGASRPSPQDTCDAWWRSDDQDGMEIWMRKYDDEGGEAKIVVVVVVRRRMLLPGRKIKQDL